MEETAIQMLMRIHREIGRFLENQPITDPVLDFIQSRLVITRNPQDQVSRKEMFELFQSITGSSMNQRVFTRIFIRNSGIPSIKKKGYRFYSGVKIISR